MMQTCSDYVWILLISMTELNNLAVITTTSDKYETAFGFTEAEVEKALAACGLSEHMEKVKSWYDGFCFGKRQDIYNPWSITKYLDFGKFDSYWANTSFNSLINRLIQGGTWILRFQWKTYWMENG